MDNYEYIKYKNLFCCHALKIEEITDKNKMFLCYYPEGMYESWYRVIFQNYRIIVDGEFDHFILRIKDKNSLEWMLKTHNEFNKNINLYSEEILKYIPEEDLSDYIELCPKKARKIFKEAEIRLKNDYESYQLSLIKKGGFYYNSKAYLKDEVERFRICISDLKKDLYNESKIDSKEFCEHFNEIINYYFKKYCTFQISEEKVNKYIDKCYASLAALFKFSELYIKNENKNLDIA